MFDKTMVRGLLAAALVSTSILRQVTLMLRFSAVIVASVFGILVLATSLRGQTPTILHSYSNGGTSGYFPCGDLTLDNSTIYGTTWNTGATTGHDYGTIFKMNPDGSGYTVLHSFPNGTNDGAYPPSGVVTDGSALYGVTCYGGSSDDGTIFKINDDGSNFRLLYSFSSSSLPWGSLTLSGSTLYGTTRTGGNGDGSVFKINTDGTGFTNLHSFDLGSGGAASFGRVIVANSKLYGTTYGNDRYGNGLGSGLGTVFDMNLNGSGYTVLHTFTGGSDGANPMAGLTLSGSALYGTTQYGGSENAGTIFSIDLDGSGYDVLHTFMAPNINDGALPEGDLALWGDELYGTTLQGYTYSAEAYGSVFEIGTDGTGYSPLCGLIGYGRGPEGGPAVDGSKAYASAVQNGPGESGVLFSIAVPEPSTFILLGVGAVALIGYLGRRTAKTILRVLFVAVLLASAVTAQADVFHMGGTRNPTTGQWTGLASLSFGTVGNPGNTADTDGYGTVGYTYQMGTYDVTTAQYCQFLNAVAKTDPHYLYTTLMASAGSAGSIFGCGITRSGSSGSYVYSVLPDSGVPGQPGYANYADFPVNYVDWGSAARFCNWLQNGQPTGPEGPGTTETGAYSLASDDSNLLTVTRNAGATYFLPSENEWYKAAYYKSGGTSAGYWAYPTKSNIPPSNVLSSTGTNNANFGMIVGSTTVFTDPTNYLTAVGTFADSPGPYGTYDMGGDVEEWNESVLFNSYRGLRAGSWGEEGTGPTYLASSHEDQQGPWTGESMIGFRVAATAVPEPTSLALLIAGAVALGIWRLRRKA